MRGRDVVYLRTRLSAFGYITGNVPDPSVYDVLLSVTVAAFQAGVSLIPTGEVDESTWSILESEPKVSYFYVPPVEKRNELVGQALLLLNTPYITGSSDPIIGLDSFGFLMCVISRALHRPIVDGDVDTIYRKTAVPSSEPQAGDVQFYGEKGVAYHLMLITNGHQGIGAVGGNKATRDRLMALRRDARVKIKPLNYRQGKMEHRTVKDLLSVL